MAILALNSYPDNSKKYFVTPFIPKLNHNIPKSFFLNNHKYIGYFLSVFPLRTLPNFPRN